MSVRSTDRKFRENAEIIADREVAFTKIKSKEFHSLHTEQAASVNLNT